MASRSYTGPNGLNPRMLKLEWCQYGEPQRWNEKILLTGSEDSKFLLLSQPTIGVFLGIFFASFSILCMQVSTACIILPL